MPEVVDFRALSVEMVSLAMDAEIDEPLQVRRDLRKSISSQILAGNATAHIRVRDTIAVIGRTTMVVVSAGGEEGDEPSWAAQSVWPEVAGKKYAAIRLPASRFEGQE